ncbi:MAG: hypothetical protein CR993_01790 [Rhodobacterales bacterium]|nr:MAG: hypothetical protein CR993_01790 [Rhodobacterales bacterium]
MPGNGALGGVFDSSFFGSGTGAPPPSGVIASNTAAPLSAPPPLPRPEGLGGLDAVEGMMQTPPGHAPGTFNAGFFRNAPAPKAPAEVAPPAPAAPEDPMLAAYGPAPNSAPKAAAPARGPTLAEIPDPVPNPNQFVAEHATQPDRLNMAEVALIGTAGPTDALTALIRLPSGEIVTGSAGKRTPLGTLTAVAADHARLRLSDGAETTLKLVI